jgi:hypothetical protein
MTSDPAFHFPPDVFSAIVDAVPLLTRGKKEVLTFFQGCGVATPRLRALAVRIDAAPKLSKYEITRELLTELNAKGEAGLSARRQVIRRIAEFDDYASCYPDNQLKAQGAVARVRELVNKKDASLGYSMLMKKRIGSIAMRKRSPCGKRTRSGLSSRRCETICLRFSGREIRAGVARRSKAFSTGCSRPMIS